MSVGYRRRPEVLGFMQAMNALREDPALRVRHPSWRRAEFLKFDGEWVHYSSGNLAIIPPFGRLFGPNWEVWEPTSEPEPEPKVRKIRTGLTFAAAFKRLVKHKGRIYCTKTGYTACWFQGPWNRNGIRFGFGSGPYTIHGVMLTEPCWEWHPAEEAE